LFRLSSPALALTAFGLACIVAAIMVGLWLRHAWIERKIAALTDPPVARFAIANADLPAKNGRPRVVLIGDSSFARWPTDELNPRWQFINRGVGGETVRQVAQRFEADALNLSPDVIVVSAGGNDLAAAGFLAPAARRKVVADTADILIELAGRARKRGVRILIATLAQPAKPELLRLPVWNESVRDNVAEVTRRLRQFSADSGVGLVDFAAALESDDGRMPEAYRADAVHLNAAGYRKAAQALERALGD
jgi:lysophospholipase L1-like esterase